MSRGRQKIEFEGLLQKNVLGTFTVMRGFADLRLLAKVSKPIPYRPTGFGAGEGYQRQLNDRHVEAIQRFLGPDTRNRFFPEVILGLRTKGEAGTAVQVSKRRASPNDAAYRVRINLKALKAIQDDSRFPIRRIDGNHRLEAAAKMAQGEKPGAIAPSLKMASFCFVVLESELPKDDDLSEAMLFNLINSKALPLMSEHSLSVLMQDDAPDAERFKEDPELYLMRWIRDRVAGWPRRFVDSMAADPLSRLHATARVLLRSGGLPSGDMPGLERAAMGLFEPLQALAERLCDDHEAFVHSNAFLPVAAEVYSRHTLSPGTGAASSAARIRKAEGWLRNFAVWFKRVGGADLPLPADPTLLWSVFKREYDSKAKSVFVAMSFREDAVLKRVRRAIDEAIASFNDSHPKAPLAPVRIDEQGGASYEIPARVFKEIDECGLMIADLTDERPNVYCEVGYALSKGRPFILTFHKKDATTVPPWDRKDRGNRVHFDLDAYRRIEYGDPMDLREQLKTDLDAFFEGRERA